MPLLVLLPLSLLVLPLLLSVAAATATAARHQSSIQPPPQQLLTLLQLEQAMCGMQWAPEANGVATLCCGNAGQLQAICRNIPQHLVHLGPACNTMGQGNTSAPMAGVESLNLHGVMQQVGVQEHLAFENADGY
jgi:hypothetical protein